MSRGVLFSGNANNGANAGFVYANTNNTASNANANIGSQLCLSKNIVAKRKPCQSSHRGMVSREQKPGGRKSIIVERFW